MTDRARTVLHVSPDQNLAGSRRRVLTAIGYDVVWVESESAAFFEISLGRCGILLLCHLLSEAARQVWRIISTPNAPILILWRLWLAKQIATRHVRMRASFIPPITPHSLPCYASV